MSTFATPKSESVSSLPRDNSGKIVETVSIQNWRPQRYNLTNAAWTQVGDGEPRTSILLRNNSETDDIIVAPNDTDYSNDPSQLNAGMTIPAGEAVEPTFAANLAIFARVELGGSPAQLEIVEAF